MDHPSITWRIRSLSTSFSNKAVEHSLTGGCPAIFFSGNSGDVQPKVAVRDRSPHATGLSLLWPTLSKAEKPSSLMTYSLIFYYVPPDQRFHAREVDQWQVSAKLALSRD